MADVNGQYIGDTAPSGGTRFSGRKSMFLLGGEDPVVPTRFYQLRGWNPETLAWEAWISRTSTGQDNPSGTPLQYVTQTPLTRRVSFNES